MKSSQEDSESNASLDNDLTTTRGENKTRDNSWSSRIVQRRRPPSLVWEGTGGSDPVMDRIWLHTSPNTTTSISVTNASIPVNSGTSSLVHQNSTSGLLRKPGESTLNSLECWDYSVELECLRGPDGN